MCSAMMRVVQLSNVSRAPSAGWFWILAGSLFLSGCYDSHRFQRRASARSKPDCSGQADGSVPPGCPSIDAGSASENCGPDDPAQAEECDPKSSDPNINCGRPTIYQSCSDGVEVCADEPNAKCAAYTQDRTSVFCAPFCKADSDCPRLPGYQAACNLADMKCVEDLPFRDCIAADRGTRSVCVPRASPTP
jgi:hypothetical protein